MCRGTAGRMSHESADGKSQYPCRCAFDIFEGGQHIDADSAQAQCQECNHLISNDCRRQQQLGKCKQFRQKAPPFQSQSKRLKPKLNRQREM